MEITTTMQPAVAIEFSSQKETINLEKIDSYDYVVATYPQITLRMTL
jgi:hypothetical protein